MRKTLPLALLAAAMLTSACATLGAPDNASLSGTPVIRFGDSPPKDTPFIMHFTAGQAIPVITRLGGTALSNPSEQTQTVSLNRDLYVYRDWLSFDRKTWTKADLLALHLNLQLPRPEHPQGGLVDLTVNWRQ